MPLHLNHWRSSPHSSATVFPLSTYSPQRLIRSVYDSRADSFNCTHACGISTLDLPIPEIGLNYAFPPVSMLTLFIRHSKSCTILIAPIWERNKFWRLLCPDHIHTGPFVKRFQRLTAHTASPDICMGPIGRPNFLINRQRRHPFEWAAFLIDTRVVGGPPRKHFCINIHESGVCPTGCVPQPVQPSTWRPPS